MMSMDVKGSIEFPKLQFQSQLMDIAEQIIKQDIHGHMESETDLLGADLPKLDEKYVTWKAKKGYSTKRLLATGTLRRSIFHEKLGKDKVIITIKPIRKKIGKYLQVDGVGKKKKKFIFFGISPIAEKRAIDFMFLSIKKQVKNA